MPSDLSLAGDPEPAAGSSSPSARARERRCAALGGCLAAQRRALGLTQQQLAERSDATISPFDRAFVANLELGRGSSSATRFLTYLSLLRVDPDTVINLVDIEGSARGLGSELDGASYQQRADECLVDHRFDDALQWLWGGIANADRGQDRYWSARLRITAAAVLRRLGSLMVARRLGEAALASAALGAADRSEAALEVGRTSILLGEVHLGYAMARLAHEYEPASDPLRVARVHDLLAQAFICLGQSHRAIPALEASVEHHASAEQRPAEALRRALLARVLWDLGGHQPAEEEMQLALATIRRWPGRSQLPRTLSSAGWLAMESRRYKEARKLLLEAEQRAKDHPRHGTLYMIRAQLMDLALRTGEAPLRRFMKAHLQKGAPPGALDPAEIAYVESIVGSAQAQLDVDESRVTNGSRKPLRP